MRASTFSLVALSFAYQIASASDAPKVPGIVNFNVVDEHVFRGAQPTPEGLKGLATLGIKTVIDLTRGSEWSRDEQATVEGLGMQYIHVPMPGYLAPADADVWRVLGYLGPTGSASWPVFVHCKRGKDRTGTVISCYRIVHDHWDNQKALREARLHGMSRLELAMQLYVLRFEAKKPAPAQ